MKNRLKSADIHDLIWDIYQQFRGTDAPVNSHTENLWGKIEQLESEGR